ncbi:hypothetical protein AZ09_03115 [Acetobacter aceti 1023]|nr:hypothetical protein AZ09_03115 [Acetobacter aceti 1023]
MIFLAPFALLGLLTLPLVWWLVRATPPRPRQQVFPPVKLLATLKPRQTETARSPLWLLLLRLAAVTLLVVGLARPVLPGHNVAQQGAGPVLLVIDNGMFSAADWNARLTAAQNLLDDAERAKRPVLLLSTAPEAETSVTENRVPLPAAQVRQHLNALRPEPWQVDRETTAHVLEHLTTQTFGSVLYLADGIATPGDGVFTHALQNLGSVREVRFPPQNAVALAPVVEKGGNVMARLVAMPMAAPRTFNAIAHTQDGGTLAVVPVTLPAQSGHADISVSLPATIRNRIDSLTLAGMASAATTTLMDESSRLHPVGLLASGGADTPLVGSLFYLRRALAPSAELHEGTPTSLLSRPLSVLIAPDGTLADPETREKVREWVKNGGTLIRFAGPALAGAQHDDGSAPPERENPQQTTQDLLPVPLLDGARQLGGSMTWGTPQKLAAFDATSPFAGLTPPNDVTVSRQVLARPSATLTEHTWARLADGTPLVTHAALGKGEIVLFHVSSTTDWSNLPLSGLFVSMLQRLTDHANGVSVPADDAILQPALTLDGAGVAGPPPPYARGLKASAFATTNVSPAHPPGLYGPTSGRRALNTADHIAALYPEKAVGIITDPAGQQPDVPLGRFCLLAALVLLLLDGVLIPLMRKGLLASSHTHAATWVMGGMLLGLAAPAHAADTPPPAPQGTSTVPGAALETRLAYVLTGHNDVDETSRQGLQGLADFTNARTSAVLGHPDGVHPETDDLAYYPLLYWPITPDAHASPAMIAALNRFMAHGGILLIDTQGQDTPDGSADDTSFAGDAPGTRAALRRATTGLTVPPLVTMDDHHLLAHTFYLLHDFPGRYAGNPIWVAREGDAGNDEVSPIIIGSADWAHAWAVDSSGNTPFAVIPGGSEQRLLAYRFGLNIVIYALTGSYKADQVHVPMLLKRLEDRP